jgi:dipeptidyl aminopeptidase/acylaminoacyl peptidase
MRLSPSGQRVALIGVLGDKRQLMIVALDGNRTLKAIAVGDNKVRDLRWAGEDHLLVMITATADLSLNFAGRYELMGVIHVGVNDAKPWTVFEKSDSVEHAVFGYYGAAQIGEHWFGYFGGVTRERTRGFSDSGYQREHTFSDLYRVNLDSGKPELVANGGEHGHDWIVATDGALLAYSTYAAASGDWTLYAANGGKVLLTKHTLTADISLLGPGRTPNTVLYLDQTGNIDRIVEINTVDGKSEDLFADHSVLDYDFDPTTGLLLGAETIEEPGELFFDQALQHHFEATRHAFSKQGVQLASFTSNLTRMVVETKGAGDSGTYWLVDSATHHADPIGYSYPTIKPDDVGPMRAVSYRAADGIPIEGILTLPPGREPKGLPLIVLPHGGPIGVFDRIGFDWWAQALTSRGYAVFQPNFRGSGGYSVEFRNAGYGEWGGKMLTDISDSIRELANQQITDPKRVCIVGGSYGGYAALAGVTMQQNIYRCAVSVSGPSDLVSFENWLQDREGLDSVAYRYWIKVTGADVGGDHALTLISPAHFASQASGPILLIHGKDDTRVPFVQSQRMASALKSAGKTFEFVELEKEDHFLSREVTRTAMLKATVEFLQKYNPP